MVVGKELPCHADEESSHKCDQQSKNGWASQENYATRTRLRGLCRLMAASLRPSKLTRGR